MNVALNAAEVDGEDTSGKKAIKSTVAQLVPRVPGLLAPADEHGSPEDMIGGAPFETAISAQQPAPHYGLFDKKPATSHDVTEKVDYMIHLLESQRDLRTGSATEDLILYGFLGVFIIFVLDSFTRSAKYRR